MDGLELLHAAREVGLTVLAEGSRLVVIGPPSLEAVALELIESKQEVMVALAAQPILRVDDGCVAHSITSEAVIERWTEVQRRELRPGACACCSGPAPAMTFVCRWCAALTPDREAELTAPRVCIRCGARGYTCDEALDWQCKRCWRGLQS